MKLQSGDLLQVTYPARAAGPVVGYAIYLRPGTRGYRMSDKYLIEVYWKGRITTFDRAHWGIEVVGFGALCQ